MRIRKRSPTSTKNNVIVDNIVEAWEEGIEENPHAL